MYIKRHIAKVIQEDSANFPVVLVTGSRQVGKSTVLRETFPDYARDTLDDLAMLGAISSDPLGYLRLRPTPLVLDEVQKAPALFGSIKYMVDTERKRGMYLLTGSQKFELMKGVSDSLAGRVAVHTLMGLSAREIKGDEYDRPFVPTEAYLMERAPLRWESRRVWETIFRGGMPALYDNPRIGRSRYYTSYVTTYIERDVRALAQVGDALAFVQFLTALAARTGELLNMAALSAEVGVSAPTIKRWISILEASNVIYLLRPFSTNLTKRAVKTPKVYFADTGLVCHLCKWNTVDSLINGAQAGNIYETYVVGEIVKSYRNAGLEPDFYFFRTREGQEVDLLIREGDVIHPVEIKKTASPNRKDIKHFAALEEALGDLRLGEGGVVCNAPSLLPLGEGNRIIPVDYV